MSRIVVLKPHIANMIAAGEVVERPASVVKELVENALDAGATAITVAVRGGGMQSLSVTDNGCGIPREECKNAFLRHATSKISAAEDLERITTLGFRGEALASIAAVSRVTMTTRPKDAEVGAKLVLENGVVLSEEEAACVYGTTFLVEALFAAVPARLKFLKSPRTEAGYIGDYLAKMILARPDVSFRYTNDDRTVYETYGDGDLFNTLFCVYGKSVGEQVIPVSYDNGYLRVTGYLGLPELSKNTRAYQTLFVNGRSIRSAALSAAVQQAYDTRLLVGRFPFFVLNLTISPREVDVNVHPAKTEVRFAEDNRVFTSVLAACKLALTATQGHVEDALQTITPRQIEPPTTMHSDAAAFAPKRPFDAPPSARQTYAMHEASGTLSSFVSTGRVGEVPTFSVQTPPSAKLQTPVSVPLVSDVPIQIVGCAFSAYWLVTRGDDLFLVDQHAAHERKLYQQLSAREISIGAQSLLLPLTVTLTPSELACLQANDKDIAALGFSIRLADALRVELNAVPVLNGVMLQESYLHAVLDILQVPNANPKEALTKSRMMQCACKHAIKAGERVSEAEIQALLAAFLNGELPLTCPHGRPVLVRITKTELEKMFRRIV